MTALNHQEGVAFYSGVSYALPNMLNVFAAQMQDLQRRVAGLSLKLNSLAGRRLLRDATKDADGVLGAILPPGMRQLYSLPGCSAWCSFSLIPRWYGLSTLCQRGMGKALQHDEKTGWADL